MHRALLRPEILSEIVKELYPDWSEDEHALLDLYSCAQTNKLFSQEAIRVLWQGCGNNMPGVRHLAHIAQKDSARAQFYASHLSYLHFGFYEEGGKEGNYGPVTFDTAYLDVLSSLDFPELESVVIYGTGEVIDDRLLECYLQPKLESFTLEGEFSGHLDKFLDTMTQRCPKIRNVDFRCKGKLTVRMGSFLEQHPRLNGFSLPPAQSMWSREHFDTICQMPELTQLWIPYIEVPWLNKMGAGWPELDELRTMLSSDAIERLTQVAPGMGIVELKLRGAPSPSDSFIKLSQLTQLRSLVVHLMRTDAPREPCINAQDLATLARNCPELFRFHISSESSHSIYGITDSLLEELTKSLPDVSEFCLDVDDTSALTFNAVCSLGKHCQKLCRARLSCNIDWRLDLETALSTGVQSRFSELELNMRGERVPLECWTDTDRENLSKFADEFVGLAPELCFVELFGGNDADEYVKKVLDESIRKRDAGRFDERELQALS
jgi:hypothetical protein